MKSSKSGGGLIKCMRREGDWTQALSLWEHVYPKVHKESSVRSVTARGTERETSSSPSWLLSRRVLSLEGAVEDLGGHFLVFLPRMTWLRMNFLDSGTGLPTGPEDTNSNFLAEHS